MAWSHHRDLTLIMPTNNNELVLPVKNMNGRPTITGLITVGVAAKMLSCCPNTVRAHTKNGKVRCVWICPGEERQIMLVYRKDVSELAKAQVKKLKQKLDKMKGKK